MQVERYSQLQPALQDASAALLVQAFFLLRSKKCSAYLDSRSVNNLPLGEFVVGNIFITPKIFDKDVRASEN